MDNAISPSPAPAEPQAYGSPLSRAFNSHAAPNGVAHPSNLRPGEGARLSRRERFDRVYPLLQPHGIELEYADPDIPSFDIGTRYLDEHGEPLPQPLPMTLNDALHPREGDKLVSTPFHNFLIVTLFNIAWARYKSDPTFMFLMDTEFDLGIEGYSLIRPDLAFLLHVQNQRDWKTARFYVDEEPETLRLMLAIEVTSKSTRQNDFIDKLVMYADAGFEQYLVLDVGKDKIEIWSYEPKRSLKPTPKREDGRTAIESLGVLIGTDGENLTFWDMETGEEIAEAADAIIELKARAKAVKAAKDEAKAAKDEAKAAENKAKAAEDKAKAAEDKAKAAENKAKAAEDKAKAAENKAKAAEDKIQAAKNEVKAAKDEAKAAEDKIQAVEAKARETKIALEAALQRLALDPGNAETLRQIQELLNPLPDESATKG